MTRYIALFRALNVGEKNRLSMQDLKSALVRVGCMNVQTYIQSGNAVFDHASDDPAVLTGLIRAELLHLNVDAELLLLSPAELKSAIDNNPFPEAADDPSTLHLGFMASPPPHPDLDALSRLKSPTEQFLLLGAVFYLYAPDGVGNSKLAAGSERLLGVPMTDRNWRTVQKIWEMVQSN
jgi:uncharacterized protein (DUF1697 family)